MSIGSFLGAAGVGSTIGQAIVQLELDSKKYSTELAAAESKTKTSTTTMGSGFSKFSGLASTAFFAVGAAAVAGLGASVKAAIDAQEAQQRLHNTIQNAPQLSAAAEQAFLDQAEAIREVTGADDEAIISGDALLGNMGLQQDQIEALAPLVVDLATKYNIDLQTAFKAVGKAAQGNTGTLARYVGTIEKGSTEGETFANVLDKLGGAAGFAAEQAKNEPWRLLSSDLEELAERIGNALLPIIQELVPVLGDMLDAATPLLDILGKLAPAFHIVGEAMQYVLFFGPKVAQFFASLGQDISSPELKQGLDDLLSRIEAVGDEMSGPALEAAQKFFPQLWRGFGKSEKAAKSFADMSEKELEDWSNKTKESFDTFVLGLDESAEATKITRKEFVDATRVMQREANQLASAMKKISKEKWVNDEYIQFLSQQGPEWLIGFADLTEKQQRRAQAAWEESTRKTDKAKGSLDKITGALDDLGRGRTSHTVEIRYKYVGFDPSKPGMGPQR